MLTAAGTSGAHSNWICPISESRARVNDLVRMGRFKMGAVETSPLIQADNSRLTVPNTNTGASCP